ncbi:nucleic acid-binding protein [Chloropicon primus]|uniref:Nucleic acid-binding protein n=2 Tax=Chloropicon primus TaxID=1764295 RepID=A0A5B8MKY3_9CHLO|nr:nucleic acid-binding protein [Chloropicon primus]UPR00341.1 nucleic acid-binding protein [Chloropicon primus]|eukprot:QDZ21127.1 nucleic acid-binding protein [Chloropicon primus]
MTAGHLDEAIGKLDGLLIDMEQEAARQGLEMPSIKFDPDDPWAKERSPPPSYVGKVRCPKSGYLMTKPFESQCPMPEAFVKDNSYLRGMLKPVVKPVNQAPAQKASTSKAAKDDKATKAAPAGGVEDFAKVLFKVARVTSVECHPDSEKLYVCKLDIGGGETRQVVAGLQKHIPIDQLQGVLVVCVANLKKAKLAGTPSEAMILAAEFESGEGVAVKTLVPPEGAQPGDIVFLEGMQPAEKFTKKLSSTVWGGVGKSLKVKGGVAHFQDHAFCVPSGKISVPAPDGTTIK